MSEMYEQAAETEFYSSAGGALASTPHKQKTGMMNIKQLGHHSHHNLSSENVVIGADEIDSECRTEDDDHYQENNLSCEGGATIDFDKESK